MASFDSLDETFNIEKREVTDIVTSADAEVEEIVPANKQLDREEDYQYARSQLYNLVDKLQETMNSAMEVAQQSDSPRAFEVVFQGAKHTADIVDKLQDLHAKEKKMSEEQPAPSAGGGVNNGTVNNVYMTGSTADLLKMLKQAKEEDK